MMYILFETTYRSFTPMGKVLCAASIVCLVAVLFGIFANIAPAILASLTISAVLTIIVSIISFTEPNQQIKAAISDDY